MTYRTRITTFCLAIFFSLPFATGASDVADLKTFTHDTPALAEDVNHNFSEVKKAVDDNHEKIIALSNPKQGSVTYSAMGFVPVDNTVRYLKNIADGSLSITIDEDAGQFFHCLTLRPGVTITRIRADVNAVTVGLYQQGISGPLATSNNSEDISITIEPFPTSYFIAVILSSPEQIFYSVAIDYTYAEP